MSDLNPQQPPDFADTQPDPIDESAGEIVDDAIPGAEAAGSAGSCRYRSQFGRRCRSSAAPNSQGYCAKHYGESRLFADLEAEALAKRLVPFPGFLATARGGQHLITHLIDAMLRNQISDSKARTLIYSISLLHQLRHPAHLEEVRQQEILQRMRAVLAPAASETAQPPAAMRQEAGS